MEGLIEGRIVHYVLPFTGNRSPGEHRPAIVVKVWRAKVDDNVEDKGCVNLQVFTDYTNDYNGAQGAGAHGQVWATSILNDETEKKPGTWHWIERA